MFAEPGQGNEKMDLTLKAYASAAAAAAKLSAEYVACADSYFNARMGALAATLIGYGA